MLRHPCLSVTGVINVICCRFSSNDVMLCRPEGGLYCLSHNGKSEKSRTCVILTPDERRELFWGGVFGSFEKCWLRGFDLDTAAGRPADNRKME